MCIFKKKKNIDASNVIPMTKVEVKKIKKDSYVLFSLEYSKEFEMKILFYSVKELSVGDILELPYCMLRMDESHPLFTNSFLCLGKPNKKMAIPKDFDINEDYAYVTYAKTNKKVKLQRYYG